MQHEQPKLTRSEQARRNGAKSTGAKTSEGRIKASFGRSRTVLYGPNTNLVTLESQALWNELQARYQYHYESTSTLCNQLVNDLVSIDFELERTKAGISRLLDLAIQGTNAEAGPGEMPHHAQTRLAQALRNVAETRHWTVLAQQKRDLRRSRREIIQTIELVRRNPGP